MNDSIKLEAYGYVDVFAPHLTPSPFPAGTRIPISLTTYKTLAQIIDDARGAYPAIPVISGVRGLTSSMHGFPFRHGATSDLQSTYGMQLRAYLASDQAFGGSRATATFYAMSEDE